MLKSDPYLSIVIVARNDKHQGSPFFEKVQLFITLINDLSGNVGIGVEIVIVEWNPPKNTPRFKDCLVNKHRKIDVKIIEVSSKIHQQFKLADSYPLHQWIGKNVGIRRARGEFVIVTNADDIFSKELIKFLSQRKLDKSSFYRVEMFDVKSPIPLNKSPEEILDFCQINSLKKIGYLGNYRRRISLEYIKCLYAYLKNKIKYYPFPVPHTNASGDFILMHKENWFRLRGFLELDIPSHYPYADGIMVCNALFSGIKQIILKPPYVIYHQAHQQINQPLQGKVAEIYNELIRQKKPIIFNDENWGLGNFNLTEYTI